MRKRNGIEKGVGEADKAGYRLLTFNGQIWAKTLNGDWILTVLNIDDFEAC